MIGTKSERLAANALAAQALQRGREQIGEFGEGAAQDRWQDDRIVWELAEAPDSSLRVLLLAGLLLMPTERIRPVPVELLAAHYVVGALLLMLVWHSRPPTPAGTSAVSIPGWSPMASNNNGTRERGDPLARALAALAEACDQARSRPALLQELRRLHHGIARIRGALAQAKREAGQRASRDGNPTTGGRAGSG